MDSWAAAFLISVIGFVYEDSIQEEIERLMDGFEDNRPKLDADTKARVRTVLLKSGLPVDILDRIEAM